MSDTVDLNHHTSQDVNAEVYFLSRDPLYDEVKPYRLRFWPMRNIPQWNLIPLKYPIAIKSMRNLNGGLDFDRYGFGVIPLQSNMEYADFADPQKIATNYASEIISALKSTLKAQHIHIIEHTLRRRHPKYPMSTEDYTEEQPAIIAHCDFTYREAKRMLTVLYGDRAEEIFNCHWQIVNVWRPLKGPVRDWPLAICDAQSFDIEKDAEPSDIVMKDWVIENIQVYHNPAQQWYWLPEQTTSELLIFKTTDSRSATHQACPHVSFYNSKVKVEDPPRESIEVRAFVLYAENIPPEVGRLYCQQD